MIKFAITANTIVKSNICWFYNSKLKISFILYNLSIAFTEKYISVS